MMVRSAGSAAAVTFLLTVAVGVVASYSIGAADLTGWATRSDQPIDWLIMSIFLAAAVIAAAATWAGITVANAVAWSTSKQLEALRRDSDADPHHP